MLVAAGFHHRDCEDPVEKETGDVRSPGMQGHTGVSSSPHLQHRASWQACAPCPLPLLTAGAGAVCDRKIFVPNGRIQAQHVHGVK
jgi:hypothetical protein